MSAFSQFNHSHSRHFLLLYTNFWFLICALTYFKRYVMYLWHATSWFVKGYTIRNLRVIQVADFILPLCWSSILREIGTDFRALYRFLNRKKKIYLKLPSSFEFFVFVGAIWMLKLKLSFFSVYVRLCYCIYQMFTKLVGY